MGEERIISLSAVKAKREAPDPEYLCADPYGQPMQRYLLEYRHDGSWWSSEIWAYSMEDAQERVEAMKDTLSLKGQLMSVQPA